MAVLALAHGLESPGSLAIPSGMRVAGTLRPPGSKSATNRALNLALLARAPLVLENPLIADDAEVFLEALAALGFAVERGAERVRLVPGPEPGAARIECGLSGTMLRFVVAALAARPGEWVVDGEPRLRERPVGPLVAALRGLGAEIEFLREPGFAPLRIAGRRLRGGGVELDASQSSQYLSALLMAALVAEGEVEVEAAALTSEPYVAITLAAIRAFGGEVQTPAPRRFVVRPGLRPPERYEVEADFSAAAYPAAAAAVTGGTVLLTGLAHDSPQGDRRLLALLAEMGAAVRKVAGGYEVAGTGELAAVDADLSDIPDQVPTLAALAPFARGTTQIRNVPHLRIKESDRLAAVAGELTRLGAEVTEHEDGLTIPGIWAGRQPPGGAVVVETHGDHRIAMSFALVGLRRPGVSIAAPGVVAKSYPRFWEDLARLLEAGG